MENIKILSLDASTTTIGLAVLLYQDGKINLIHLEHFKPNKELEIFEMLNSVRNYIIDKIKEFQPDEVCLEDIVLFMKGHSTAQTISSLAILNRTVGLAVYNQLGKSPNLLSVMKIRHAIKKNKIFPKKEEIPDLVASHLKIEFPWMYNKKGKPLVENFDRADGIACGLAYLKLKEKEIEKTKKQLQNKRNKSVRNV